MRSPMRTASRAPKRPRDAASGRKHAPARPKRESAHYVGWLSFGVATADRPKKPTDGFQPFQAGGVERVFRDFPRRKADHQKAPSPGNRAQRGLGIFPAHRIIDHVGAF